MNTVAASATASYLTNHVGHAQAGLVHGYHIAFIVSAEKTPASKPDPAPFLLGLKELARVGHRGATVAVEDSTGGITSAKRAGLRCVAVAHSYPRDVLLAAGADAVAPNLAELTDTVLESGI